MLVLVAQVYHDLDYGENVNYYTYHSNCILKTLQSEISSVLINRNTSIKHSLIECHRESNDTYALMNLEKST